MAETNNDKIKEILENVTITSCNNLVPPSSYPESPIDNSNVHCGDALDMDKVLADMKCNTGWAWSSTGSGVKHYDNITQCSCKGNWGKCTPSVAGHLVAGGFKWNTRCGYGLEMHKFLEQYGVFERLNLSQEECNTNNKIRKLEKNNFFQIGDICCQSHGAKQSGTPSVPGHACMWDGKQWVSDFIQCWCLVYDGGNRDKVYDAVYFYRHKACKSGEQTNPLSNLKEINCKYVREKIDSKYSYGKFYVNGQYYCDACDCGKDGSSNPYSKDSTNYIIGTYDIYIANNVTFTHHANKPEDYKWSPEFGSLYDMCRNKDKQVMMPMIGSVKGNAKDCLGKEHTDISIHSGRGSVNSLGCLVLGKIGSGKVVGGNYVFTDGKSTKEVEEQWEIFKKFWQTCYKIFLTHPNNKKIGKIEIVNA